MNLRQFAKINGVTFVDCGPGWGGRVGYKESEYPNCTIAGYKTQTEAAEAWLHGKGFSEHGIAVFRKALEQTR